MAGVRVVSRVWIAEPGGNPFGLAMPPRWWLQLLITYDDQLAIMPSRTENAYRLVRYVPREQRLGLQKTIVHQHPDTQAMCRLGVQPVATVLPWAVRSDKIIRDLQARDLWRHGRSGAQVAHAIEARERADETRQDRTRADDLIHLSGEAYRSLKLRTGAARSMHDPQRGRLGKTASTDRTRTVIGPGLATRPRGITLVTS
jgi:hypothetical protein